MDELNTALSAQAEMSDADFMKQDFTAPQAEEAQESHTETDEGTEHEGEEAEQEFDEAEAEGSTDEAEDTDTGTSEELDESGEALDDVVPDVVDSADKDDKAVVSEFEKKILAPFRANGRDVTVANAEEAIQLMQMGANYHKKMTGLKKHQKQIKMLENNDLLDEGKLSFAIDLMKKDKGAIAKLLKEANIDPLDLDESSTDYVPNDHSVSDNVLSLNEVLDDIRETPSFNETIDVVSKRWDESSRQALVSNPKHIKVINDMIGSGAFKHITDVVEQQQMLGKLAGMSDLKAFEHVAAVLYPIGKPTEAKPVGDVAYKPPVKKNEDPALQKKKQALSSNPRRPQSTVKPASDLSDLSDEDFMKAMTGK